MAKPVSGSAIVVLTVDDLRGVVSDAVEQTLAKCGPQPDSDIMNSQQCADLLGRHKYTLPKLIAQGLPTLRPLGKERRFSRRAVLAWLAVQKVE